MKIVDVWMQHPTRRFLEQPFFESLRRWAGQDSIPEIPLSLTVDTMDQAGVDVGLVAAWTQEIISLATKFPNLYIDTSAYKATRFPADFVDFLRGRGARKVMFGTNYPMPTAAACLEGLATLGLSQETRRLHLSDNARRVFKMEAT